MVQTKILINALDPHKTFLINNGLLDTKPPMTSMGTKTYHVVYNNISQ